MCPEVNKEMFYNLGLMIVCWVSTSFTYFLVIFLVKYLPGNLYMNQLVSGFSVLGYLIVPGLAARFDNRKVMIMGYVITLIFLVLMLLKETGYLHSTGEIGYSIVFFLFRSGVSMVFISLFVIH
jgi:Na+/melibiose symporter-like transporter